jgi:hypothetical protein
LKLCIPPLGALIRLSEEWGFRLYFEDRNATLLAALLDGSKKIVVPAGKFKPWTGVGAEPIWHTKQREDWSVLFARFKDAGFTIRRSEKPQEPATEVYKSFLTQIPLPYIDASLPPGTVLAFDRYYIRQGAEAFDSLTFKIEKCDDLRKPAGGKAVVRRFWARLQDVNNIEGELLG